MINVVGDSITVAGTHDYRVFQLGTLIQHYLDNYISVVKEVIEKLSENVDISFHDCYFRRWEDGREWPT